MEHQSGGMPPRSKARSFARATREAALGVEVPMSESVSHSDLGADFW
jgi:hypothetical protein